MHQCHSTRRPVWNPSRARRTLETQFSISVRPCAGQVSPGVCRPVRQSVQRFPFGHQGIWRIVPGYRGDSRLCPGLAGCLFVGLFPQRLPGVEQSGADYECGRRPGEEQEPDPGAIFNPAGLDLTPDPPAQLL